MVIISKATLRNFIDGHPDAEGAIIFKVRTVYILFFGSHNEYDQVDAATITFKK